MSDTHISAKSAGTLDGLFRERVSQSPDQVAYKHFDRQQQCWNDISWADMARDVSRWQNSLRNEQLEEGDRVGLMVSNNPFWVIYEQAALGLGLVVVPLYVDDRPDNISYILNDAGVKVLLLEHEKQHRQLLPVMEHLEGVQRFIIINSKSGQAPANDERAILLQDWLGDSHEYLHERGGNPQALATIVYTSGTTGRPKGVMLSHQNILFVADSVLSSLQLESNQHIFVSFLPLSHMLERTGGYYLPMMLGATVAYARSIQQLASDIETIRPTVLISVPRIYERIYERLQNQLQKKSFIARGLFNLTTTVGWQRFEYQQGRKLWSPAFLLWPLLNRLVARKLQQRLGGRMQIAVTGGAALPPLVARTFIGLGINLLQGYGLTETSPVLSVNLPQQNKPASVGNKIDGIELQTGEHDELLARGPSIMLGYWNNHQATSEMIDNHGWLHTGDKARIDDEGFVHITGRIKDIIVMSNGEKIPPVDMEGAIALDPLFEQVLVTGEGKAFLSALVVLNGEEWVTLAKDLDLDPFDKHNLSNKHLHSILLKHIAEHLKDFPVYAKIRRVTPLLEPWTIENDLLTPTLKVKRAKVLEKFQNTIELMYKE
ncbi:MAG: long-chain fatty acid--CoA ligase [Thioalkalispiraceae bacterium]|jgi:long-chain acyl-CoA synthetase